MANKKRKNQENPKTVKSSTSGLQKLRALSPNKKRRLMIQALVGAGVLAGGGVALATYDRRRRTTHDLSVIGQGLPVIVQVHDPACTKCRSLKARTEKALKQYPEGHVLYRLADVTTADGRKLQEKYRAATVTLLMFDAKGSHQGTLHGVRPQADISAAIEELFFSNPA